MSWLQRLREGLGRSSARMGGAISATFSGKRRLDAEAIEELEELLIGADLGVRTASKLSQDLAQQRFDQEVTDTELKQALVEALVPILEPVAQPLELRTARPHVVLVVGVNGVGKTTTLAKLAQLWSGEGKRIVLGAGDTFRAAAIDQLKVWSERLGVSLIAKQQGADPAGLAFEALEYAASTGADVLLLDTAGRLHNKQDLMAELQKVVRVLKKLDPEAPHSVLLVLDATTGQNALSQVQAFKALVEVTGLVVTKLDGTAKGGVVVALAEQFGLPIHAVGVGEGAEDLRPFEAQSFAEALVGLEP